MPSSGFQTCARSEEHTSELQSHDNLVCRLLLEKKSPDPHGASASPVARHRAGRPARELRGAARVSHAEEDKKKMPGGAAGSLGGFFFLMFGAPTKISTLPLHNPFQV